MGGLGAILRQCLVVIEAGGDRVETQVELVFPAKFEAGFAQSVVAVLRTGVTLREIRSVGSELVGDDADFDIVLVR